MLRDLPRNERGHEAFNYNGFRSQLELDHEWWWDDDAREYYDDHGNSFPMDKLAGLSPQGVQEFLDQFNVMPPNDDRAIQVLVEYARKLVAA